MMQPLAPIVLIAPNPLVRSKLERVATRANATLTVLDRFDQLIEVPDAVAIVVDLDHPASLDAVASIRSRFPSALAAGFVSMPDRERWEKAGEVFDLVATRGAIASQLESRLATWQGPRAAKRIRLFDERDTAGRIGLIHRTETPAGPVAIFHVAKTLCAVRDVCPHAGAILSEGTLEGTVLTCPRHGSQFDVRDGSRVRGPSDEPIASYPVAVEAGVAYLEMPEP